MEAVRLANESDNVSQVARELGVSVNSLHRWRRAFAEDGKEAFPGKGNVRDEELVRLQRENARLHEEVTILKKAVGIFSSRPK